MYIITEFLCSKLALAMSHFRPMSKYANVFFSRSNWLLFIRKKANDIFCIVCHYCIFTI